MFSLHLLHGLQPHFFGPKEWEFFTGELVLDVDNSSSGSKSKDNFPSWIPNDRRTLFTSFVETFPSLARSLRLQEDGQAWSQWIQNPKCELDFPVQVELSHQLLEQEVNNGIEILESKHKGNRNSVTAFQRLLFVKVLRPDRLLSATQVFVQEALQLSSLSPPPLVLQQILEESRPDEPIMFLTMAGADPSQELEDFASKKVGKDKWVQIALGSGQTDVLWKHYKQLLVTVAGYSLRICI